MNYLLARLFIGRHQAGSKMLKQVVKQGWIPAPEYRRRIEKLPKMIVYAHPSEVEETRKALRRK